MEYGEVTRGLRRAWSGRMDQGMDDRDRASSEELRTLFHDVGLFPSKSQIFEMVQCARECSAAAAAGRKCCRLSSNSSTNAAATSSGCDRSSSSSAHSDERRAAPAAPEGDDDVLTFGEFAFFAAELKKCYAKHGNQKRQHRYRPFSRCSSPAPPPPPPPPQMRTQKSSTSAYDVFLGGSCNPTTWRADVAIPFLKGHEVTYYNPQQLNWVPEMIELEHQAKQTSQVMLFVLDEQTRNIVSMVEVAYMAGAGRRLIVVLCSYPSSDHSICDEKINPAECADLNGAMTMVHDLVEREGAPVFANLDTALSCARKVLREGVAVEDLSLSDRVTPVRLAHLQVGDRLIRAREAFNTLDTAGTGKITLADVRMAFRTYAQRDLSRAQLIDILRAHGIDCNKTPSDGGQTLSDLPLGKVSIDFDHFCCVLAEFKNGADASGCAAASSAMPSTSTGSSSKREKATGFLRRRVVAPLSKLLGGGKHHHHNVQLRPRRGHNSHSPSPPPNSHSPPAALLSRRGSQVRDVYLGGTLRGGNHWRDSVAIPALKKRGLTFHDARAAQSSRAGRLIPLEAAAMDNSRCLLFVVLGCSRSVSVMCEAAYHVGRRGRDAAKTIVLCVQKVPEEMDLDGTGPLSKTALKDYNRGRAYLSDIANREGVPVFEDVEEAVECISQRCKSLSSNK